MAQEIERKFLVVGDAWRDAGDGGTAFRQGYLSTDPERNVRVRTKGTKAVLTIKGKARGAAGLTRAEFEVELLFDDAEAILDGLCLRPIIEKVRHRVEHGGLVWEIDEFSGDNAGLVVAEVELESEEQAFDRPAWLGEEVSDDSRYLNASLVERPYSQW
ncbi:MAG: CYTH domain-containing protein [Acidobacteriota bacterium]